MDTKDDGQVADTMRAVVLTGHGGLDKLEYRTDVPTPTPGPDEVLVRVGACGLNNTDINTRTGWYDSMVQTSVTEDLGIQRPRRWGGVLVEPVNGRVPANSRCSCRRAHRVGGGEPL